MLRIDSRNVNFNGTSVINDGAFVTMNASVNDPDNNGYISISISDMAKFRANLAAIKVDIASFVGEIVKLPSADGEEE